MSDFTLYNQPYHNLSMNGVITYDDGMGTVISDGKIKTDSILSSNQVIENGLIITGNEASTSPSTGTLIIRSSDGISGGGIGCAGNIHCGKSIFLNDNTYKIQTNNINQVDSSGSIHLFTDINPNGIYFGNLYTPLYLLSPITIVNNQFYNLSISGTIYCDNIERYYYDNVNLYTTALQVNMGFGETQFNLNGYTTQNDNLINNDLGVGNNISCQNIVSHSIITNNIQTLELNYFSNNIDTCGDLVGYIKIKVNGKYFLMPYFDLN